MYFRKKSGVANNIARSIATPMVITPALTVVFCPIGAPVTEVNRVV